MLESPIIFEPAPTATVRRKRGRIRRVKQVALPRCVYPINWRDAHRQFRRAFLSSVLAAHGGNIQHSAHALGIVRRTLQIQMRAVGLCDGIYEDDCAE
ncbi:MAG: hypothetical protein IPG71_01775 [bacterium]|nr:hypothetical protein [bacterium]